MNKKRKKGKPWFFFYKLHQPDGHKTQDWKLASNIGLSYLLNDQALWELRSEEAMREAKESSAAAAISEEAAAAVGQL